MAQKAHYPFVLLVLLIFSALISGFEVAFFSLSPDEQDRLQNPATSQPSEAGIRYFTQHPKKLLATILIANNAVNMSLIVLMAAFFMGMRQYVQWPEWGWVLLETGLIGALLLLLGEITPKVYAANRPMKFLRLVSPVMRIFYLVFFPLSWILARSARLFEKDAAPEEANITYRELKHAIDITSEHEAPKEEKQILKALVSLNSIPVRAIMRPRIDLKAVDIAMSAEEIKRRIQDFGYSRIPVYDESLDNIRGILYIKDFLRFLEHPQENETSWRELIREPYFVPESTKINRLLNRFQAQRLHIAVVVDEFGGTSGIISLQDILEEIFGDIYDEFDKFDRIYSRLGADSFLFDAKMPLLDVCRVAGLPDDAFKAVKGENDSLGGLLLELEGRFPEQGQTITCGPYAFEVMAVTSKVIKQVKLTVTDRQAIDAPDEGS